MDNRFQNTFPVENTAPDKIGPPEKSRKNLSVLNVGQILILAILFIIICLQTANLLFATVQNITAEPLNNDSGIITQQPETPDIPDRAAESVIEAAPPSEPEIIFILGEHNGKLAVLSPDGQTVYETFNVYISTLPEYDRNLLFEGIKIKTSEELSSLLEDFNS